MNVRGHYSKAARPEGIRRLFASIWFFPIMLTLVLLVLTICKINGSSMGVYYPYFHGTTNDPNLIVGHPQSIRSDEWVVTTQMTIAQKNDHYARVNKNIGDGQDMSVISDVPYKEWSEIFKPHNLAFFVMPFDNAFAFKWWVMSYLLILSAYFFVLALLPGRRLLAALLSLALVASAFVQWWYQYITIAPIYYSLFAVTAFIHIMRTKERKHAIALAVFLAYIVTSFILVLYPPFQIACALAVVAFAVGYVLQQRGLLRRDAFWRRLGLAGIAIVAGGIISLIFFGTRMSVVHSIENTAYPGKRLQASGGYNLPNLLSGTLDFQLESTKKSAAYQLPKIGVTNQSEDANFILLLPFLLLPSAYILVKDKQKGKPTDWPLLFVNAAFVGALVWLFVPHVPLIGKLLALDRVPHNRLLIGIGLLNLITLVVLIRRLITCKGKLFERTPVLIYAALVFAIELLLGLHAKWSFPGFISLYRVIAFAIPVPVIIYAVLRKQFVWAAVGLLAFSFIMVVRINPLYRGTSILTQTPLSKAIQSITAHDPGSWGVEIGQLENFPVMNDARSLSGVFAYPQLSLWAQIDPGNEQYIYNRYAHVNFTFYRDRTENEGTVLALGATADHFNITTEPCGAFLRNNSVRFLLTDVPINDSCTQLVRKVTYPTATFLIYKIKE